MRDVPILKLGAIMIVLTVITSVIMLIPDWFGEQASTAADDIDTLFDISIVFSSFVFSVVMVLLGYAIWRWRAKPGDESDGEPIHGNTRLEIAWTLIPTVIVAFLAALSWIVLDDIEAKESDSMPLTVTGQQFAWEFEYPEAGKTSREFHVPVDRQLDVELRALDVLHSFWVPEWRIKRDLVPGAPGSAPSSAGSAIRRCGSRSSSRARRSSTPGSPSNPIPLPRSRTRPARRTNPDGPAVPD
jgi:cytochrome c oxidase subunit II